MNIDSLTYQLNENNFFTTKHSKELIVIGNSFSEKLNHFTGWLNRFDGDYKKTANYTVTRNQDNEFTCSCPATDYRPYLKACKHIKRLKVKLRL